MENQQPQPSPPAEHEEEASETINSSNSTLINTFCEITSASQSEALFYLESHNFDLDSALSTFLESSTPSIPAAVVSGATPAAAATTNNNQQSQSPTQSESYSPSKSESPIRSFTPSRSRSPSPPPPRRSQYNLRSSTSKPSAASAASGRRGGASGIRTLADLNRQPIHDGGSDDDSDEPQEYYTGGEKSGMLVQDPSKANDVDAIFNQARQAGAVERPAENVRSSSSSRRFTGTARLLSGDTVSSAPQHPEIITHDIIFWSNGFTIDDGPLRRLDDPENASFLESIRRSECPKELQPANASTVVHVNLIRKDENYNVPERSSLPFQGVGRTLGSSSNTMSVEPTTIVPPLITAPAPTIGLVVDQALPSTSIQLRLADGTRMVSRFNYHHTIRDIRGFIDASRPGGSGAYQLQTVGFPPNQLIDLDQTIEEAGLANSVVIQKH
ncbi:hypothetical protein ACH5RR_029263 [Cinchona calisaya]|uniref:UBA and UBX domain-containing protein n=1 Tax=Cinchona calisaya TaxID=153742 RepID=A0ABD2YR57_9GENT